MQLKTVSFIVNLTPDTRRRHTHTRLKGKVLSFTVQLEVLVKDKVKDKWFLVVRYDTAHGYAHKHLFQYRKEAKKTPLFTHNYSEALDFADADIKTNWEFYRKNFLKGVEDD